MNVAYGILEDTNYVLGLFYLFVIEVFFRNVEFVLPSMSLSRRPLYRL